MGQTTMTESLVATPPSHTGVSPPKWGGAVNWRGWPPFSWFCADRPVKVHLPGGRTAVWQGGAQRADGKAGTRFSAIALPDDLVLSRSVYLPHLPAAEVRAALELEVNQSSPFPAADRIWGYVEVWGNAGGQTYRVVMASRPMVQQHIKNSGMPADVLALATRDALEHWHFEAGSGPAVFWGPAREARTRAERRLKHLTWALVAMCAAVAVALAASPSVQLYMTLLSAKDQMRRVQADSSPAQAQRELVLKLQEQLQQLAQVSSSSVEPAQVLAHITDAVPDDSWLQRMQWSPGGKVVLHGLTPNAAQFMTALGKNPGIREVKAPSPATKAAGTGKENFVIDFVLSTPSTALQATP